MIQFSKLRLHGFKSFVDKTELEIGPGLTGIVGPNGCGKSNLVEALRWSMGESSSKRMRGGSGSMDDVIFAGTQMRPQRNVAEVSVLLDNTRRTAPGPYNNNDEIEVVRRIERDSGSGYRINGKPVRARDVQLLYADILSGANSPYLVSQGKVANLINAKPLERRQVLEEAAGISGLYARRHEAEIRLRAADKNLARLEDLLGSMDSRLQSLKKQARQATKYSNLSAQIRQLEVMIAALEWKRAYEKLREVEKNFGAIESRVAEHLTVVTQLTRTQTVQAKDLPDLRQKEAEMSAALQARKLALQRLEDEAERLAQQLSEAKSQLAQISTDREHETVTLKENTLILERLEGEEKGLLAKKDKEDDDLQGREDAKAAQQEKVDALDAEYTRVMEELAAGRARKQSLANQVEQDKEREAAIKQRLESFANLLKEAEKQQDGTADIGALRKNLEELEGRQTALLGKIESGEKAIEETQSHKDNSRHSLQEQRNKINKLSSEINALSDIVKSLSEEQFRPVFEDIQTDQGFEIALSRALGDTLMASTDDDAPIMWTQAAIKPADLPDLPAGVESLLPHVKAPKALELTLSQIGLVEDEEQGRKLAEKLRPGQSLVSKGGAYWRWDGLFIRVSAADRHAVQLQQQNRLLELEKQLPAEEAKLEKQEEQFAEIEKQYTATQEQLKTLQAERRTVEGEVRAAQNALNEAIEAQSSHKAELAKLQEALSIAETDLKDLNDTLKKNQIVLEGFDDEVIEEQEVKIGELKERLGEERTTLQDLIRDFELSKQEHSRRTARLQAIGDERINLQNRCIRARERLKELDEREKQLTERVEELKKRPAEIKTESESLLSRINEDEKEKAIITDKLATGESELAETTSALKEAESHLGRAREERAHAQATIAERQRQIEEIRQHIFEKFDMSPEQLCGQAALSDEAMSDLEELKGQREKAVRDRDMIGPVNLRAEQEAEELDKELTTILNERNDLVEAINELRTGINTLNKEARERLQNAFERVNAHFRDMFSRLFIGGKAHLALIESDDPLEAGLEIFAQPPGKALQSLSLLSGGEQTLTAIALIFAMFLTNPAPICVLDEVDAPLDDANVDRFCDLLEEFADRGETRFLLITHHRLTMARMDRLYGVTMAEKGVSKLVSVDMNQQLDFLEAAE